MTDRDRLVELLKDTLHEWECDVSIKTVTEIAEHLISNGVTVPPCKAGDTVYSIEMRIVDKRVKYKVCEIPFSLTLWENGWEDIFLTREEAERALKEREDND